MELFSNLSTTLKHMIFGYTPPRCIGVDISTTAIKLVVLAPDSLQIANYRIRAIPPNLVINGVIKDLEQLAVLLAQECLELATTYRDIAIALPYSAIILRELTCPQFRNRYQQAEFIRQKLIKELDNSELVFDFWNKPCRATVERQGIDEDFISRSKTDVVVETQAIHRSSRMLEAEVKTQPIFRSSRMLAQSSGTLVAKKELIEEYQALIQMAGMGVAAIDVEPFAIQYLLERVLCGTFAAQQQILVLDLGATRFKAWVLQNQQQLLFKEVTLAEIRSAGANRAELNLVAELTAVVSTVVKLVQLVRVELLVQQKMNLVAPRVYLSGGNALIPGVSARLEELYLKPMVMLSELLAPTNSQIPAADLMRLVTALAVATWGHKIGSN